MQHEQRRLDVFRRGYDAYLKPLQALSTKCGIICRSTASQATGDLEAWLNEMGGSAVAQYAAYVDPEQAGIDLENAESNLIMHYPSVISNTLGEPMPEPLFNGMRWAYTIKNPGKLTIPICPKGNKCWR